MSNRQKTRLLNTGSTRWRRIRSWVLLNEPLCRHCSKMGRVTEATDVDHIDGDSHNNAPENLCALCRSCHSQKTRSEQTGRVKPVIGTDGAPEGWD